MVENITPKKQVIALENVNKLCSKHGFHSVEDEEGCDIKSEQCSSTVPMEQSIGDEKESAKACLLDLKKDHLDLVGCFGFNGPLRQYFSLYRAVSQREGEREERG